MSNNLYELIKTKFKNDDFFNDSEVIECIKEKLEQCDVLNSLTLSDIQKNKFWPLSHSEFVSMTFDINYFKEHKCRFDRKIENMLSEGGVEDDIVLITLIYAIAEDYYKLVNKYKQLKKRLFNGSGKSEGTDCYYKYHITKSLHSLQVVNHKLIKSLDTVKNSLETEQLKKISDDLFNIQSIGDGLDRLEDITGLMFDKKLCTDIEESIHNEGSVVKAKYARSIDLIFTIGYSFVIIEILFMDKIMFFTSINKTCVSSIILNDVSLDGIREIYSY